MKPEAPHPPPSAFRIRNHQPPPAPDASAELELGPDPEPLPLKLEKKGITRETPGELGDPEVLWAETIAIKLTKAGMREEATTLRECCTQRVVRTCKGCGDERIVLNHCDNLYCPKCAHRIARRRKHQLEWWTRLVKQPKHVVLTVRNSTYLDKDYLAAVKRALRQLRASKFARGWRGGCWSLEITNEGRGWHVHLHLLVDANWIDAQQLALEWGKRVHQDFAIVKVLDVRQSDYLREVAKYVAKGSEIAHWSPEEIATFIRALDGTRTFGIFGTLFGQLAEWKRAVETAQDAQRTCPCCGCTSFRFLSENEHEWNRHVCGFA